MTLISLNDDTTTCPLFNADLAGKPEEAFKQVVRR